MNEFVPLPAEPMRNSLILTGLVLRTRSAIDADWPLPQAAVPIRSPLNGAWPDVTLIVLLMLAPGATVSVTVTGPSVVHPAGALMPSLTPETGAPVVFVNVTIVSCVEPGENVCRPGGPGAIVEATMTWPALPLPEESATV